MKIVFAIIGLYIGAMMDQWPGAVFGLIIGLLSGTLIQYSKRIKTLEDQVKQLLPAPSLVTGTEPAVTQKNESHTDADTTLLPPDSLADRTEETDGITLVPPYGSEATVPAASGWAQAARNERVTPPSGTENAAIKFMREFFTTGNVVVKIGAIILLFGISFLLKLVSEHHYIPVEMWFVAVTFFAIFLLVTGWRLRKRKLQFALVIQGTGVGIFYITVFVATLERFALLPLGFAFALMCALVLSSCALAVLQNAMSLAVFATIGGFLAPILTSSATGSHVALFSYYALLNAGIFGIAWHKSWRALNWTGFVFTFVIASLWGYQNYQPEFFSTTEPFLILFFAFYVAIAILFAHRQPPELKGFVDSSIVFGTPLVGFTLQSGLVREIEFGQAWSALVIATVYIALARLLWNRQVAGMRMLTEAFLALGIIFASLAIPLALDGRWTAAAWAVEGGGMMWIGIRQNRLLPRLFGLLLQIGAGVAFATVMHEPHGDLPVLNSAYLGAVMISLAGLFTSYLCHYHHDRLREEESPVHMVLLVWGLLWWFGAGLAEIDQHLTGLLENNAELFFFAFSMYYLFIIARALRWTTALKPQALLLPLMALLALIDFADYSSTNPFARYGIVCWPTAFVVQYLLLYRSEDVWNPKLVSFWHRGTLWLACFILTWSTAQALSRHVPGLENWAHIMWGLIPAMVIFALIYFRDRNVWPLSGFRNDYLGAGLLPLIIYLAIWVVIVCFHAGNPYPLPYVPVINPHEMAQTFVLLALFDWLSRWKRNEVPPVKFLNADHSLIVLAAIAFIWLNTVVARSLHFYGNVTYAPEPMLHSTLFQTSISIVWTLTAFVLMGMATRKAHRRLWFTGAALLGMVVLKLFIVDLADTGTVARIVSFVTVGVLMLVIGYFSPLPPRNMSAAPVTTT